MNTARSEDFLDHVFGLGGAAGIILRQRKSFRIRFLNYPARDEPRARILLDRNAEGGAADEKAARARHDLLDVLFSENPFLDLVICWLGHVHTREETQRLDHKRRGFGRDAEALACVVGCRGLRRSRAILLPAIRVRVFLRAQ
jgi:hypothetical protein